MHSLRLLLASACILVPAGGLALAACGDDDPVPASPDAGEDNASRPRPPDVVDEDAGLDATRPPVTLPSCVGTPLPFEVAGRRAYVDVKFGPTADPDAGPDAALPPNPIGAYIVDFGTTGSTIDFHAWSDASAGPAPQPTYCAGDAAAPGAFCDFNGFDFFGNWGFVTLRTDVYTTLFASRPQAGIIATDFLSLYAFTLDYTNQRIYKATETEFCTEAQLLASGFRPLSSAGFFTKDISKLRPLSDVLDAPDANETKNFTVANVPTVPVSIAGIDALAQLDTGYEDRLVPYSINVNEALFAKIFEKDDKLLERDAINDIYVTTCVPGYSEPIYAYRLAPGQSVDFIAEGGGVARKQATAEIYLKKGGEQTKSCGGIATWTVPAAQIGSSFYVDAQALVFDPVASRVWVPKN